MPLLILFLMLPLLFGMLFLNVLTLSFAKLGLHPFTAMLLLVASLLGSVINIPVSRQKIRLENPKPVWLSPLVFYEPPRVAEQVIFVNLGGAIIPVLFSLYLIFTTAPFWPTATATAIMIAVSKKLARPVPGRGIAMPFFVPPMLAALTALVIAPSNAAPVAYVAGAMGTLIGADLLNIHQFKRLGSTGVSIGGAGVFDGVFLVAVVAALLS